MNTPEGIRRIATAIQWIGDGLGVVVALVFIVAGVFDYQSRSKYGVDGGLTYLLGEAAIGVVGGAVIAGMGRLISWVIKGFAEPKAPGG